MDRANIDTERKKSFHKNKTLTIFGLLNETNEKKKKILKSQKNDVIF